MVLSSYEQNRERTQKLREALEKLDKHGMWIPFETEDGKKDAHWYRDFIRDVLKETR